MNRQRVDTIKRRGIRRVVHFHCDHFEPLIPDASGQEIGPDHIRMWLARTEELPFARNATLFYESRRFTLPNPDSLRQRIGAGTELPPHLPGDVAYFDRSSYIDKERQILELVRHRDLQLHVHHEHWSSGPITKWPVDGPQDGRRLDFYLGLLLGYFRGIGISFDHWGFVHGCWSLNASDRSICQITDEIRILMAHGCFGDFSFPAGRPHCDPVIKMPFTVLPLDAERAYDNPGAQPIRVGEGAFQPGRFLVWSSGTGHDFMSLEMIFDRNPEDTVLQWLSGSPVIGDTMFIKTHAHSMFRGYWNTSEDTSTPFFRPVVSATFGILDGACREADIELRHVNLSEAMTILRALDGSPV